MLKQFLHHISENELASAADKIVLAVSGGLDSMVMMDLFLKAGFKAAVAHCNFLLRGDESDGDEAFVKSVCEKLSIPFFTIRFDTKEYATDNSISIQMAARNLRYDWFNSLLVQKDFNLVATAHHLNDSLETVLFNWVNGSSINGFTGIPVKNEKVIRPLLFATREQLEVYAKENNIEWREDSSNETDEYKRNFIRHQIIPRLKELNPSLESTFERGQRKLSGELSFFEKSFAEWKSNFMAGSSTSITIDKKAFEGIESSGSLLHKAITKYGFNFDTCEEIIEALEGQPGKKFMTTDYLLVVDREKLIVTRHQGIWEEVHIAEGQQKSSLGTWEMEIRKAETFKPLQNLLTTVLDADLLKFPLRWRKWKNGDYFYPLGMDHRKKLSDFLIDTKVPVSEKESLTVLESDGEIIWVVGHRIDNRFKLTSTTTNTISFSVSPHFTQ